jgi:uncharacterized membrane protein
MNRELTFLGGCGLGLGLMYLLDPDRGRARRARLRDKAIRAMHETSDALDVIGRDLSHRSTGLMAETRSLFTHDEPTDQALAERVRSKMGRIVSHPGAIDVTARDGRVTLGGRVLAHEVKGLLACVSSVAGVRGVDNRLEVHEQAGNLSDLQGGVHRPGARSELMQENWSPTTRLLAGALGGGLTALGTTLRFPTACVLGTVGLGLLTRGVTNLSLRSLLGIGGGRPGFSVQKTITVNAPLDRVFDFWSRYENFPRFMAHVREVRPEIGSNRSHWVVAGPAGVPIAWDTIVTEFVPNEVLAWETVPGSLVKHCGRVRFEEAPGGGTRLDIHMCYDPPGGALGHAVAALFGSDPRSALNEDLVRFQTLLETGKTRAHGERVTRRDLAGAAWERGMSDGR